MPLSRAIRSRSSYIALNFHVVSTWSSGNGGGEGKKALRARWSITALSLPTLYSITGRAASAITSRRMWMLSASSRSRWVSVFVMPRPLPACPPTRKLYGLLPGQAILAGSRRDFRLLPVAADRLDGRQPPCETRRDVGQVRPVGGDQQSQRAAKIIARDAQRHDAFDRQRQRCRRNADPRRDHADAAIVAVAAQRDARADAVLGEKAAGRVEKLADRKSHV